MEGAEDPAEERTPQSQSTIERDAALRTTLFDRHDETVDPNLSRGASLIRRNSETTQTVKLFAACPV